VTGPEEDELPDWWRGPVAVEPAPNPAAGWKRIPAGLVTCVAAGCEGAVRPPWKREPGVAGVRDDYCSRGCVPEWLREVPPRRAPRDQWIRSGGTA
jgi:hypothetical protein